MSEAGLTDMPPSPPGGDMSLRSSLQSLRNEGAQRLDPVRFHYMEVMLQRTQAAHGAVQNILEAKLKTALADYGERFRRAQKTAQDTVAKLSAQHPELVRELRPLFTTGDYQGIHRRAAQAALPPPRPPLAALNQYIQQATQDNTDTRTGHEKNSRLEMKSVRRFREVWSKMAAEKQVTQAMGRGPENAGPLNSHTLVLRSLALMRGISPDYLRRFMSHVDTLLWLDQAGQKHAQPETKPVRRSRSKK